MTYIYMSCSCYDQCYPDWLIFKQSLYVIVEQPESPLNLTLVKKTSRTIKVKWQPPYDGNSPIQFYSVQYKEQKGQRYSNNADIILNVLIRWYM